MLTRALLLRMADSPAVERLVRRNPLSAALARRFVAGQTFEDAAEPVRALNRKGIAVSLDYLGENVQSTAEADESARYYQQLPDLIASHGLDANVSLKLTQLGLDIGDAVAESYLRGILERAAEQRQFVRVDMEGSAYTQRTLDLVVRLRAQFPNVGTVIQSYMRSSAADVDRLIAAEVRVRLVKGAYREPPEVAFQAKREVDQSFVRLMQVLLERGDYPAIATHDEAILRTTRGFAAEHGLPAGRYEFQMLYGIRRDLQEQLASSGYRMRVYVPFGTQWYGYMMRRLAERPANLWFVLRHLLRR